MQVYLHAHTHMCIYLALDQFVAYILAKNVTFPVFIAKHGPEKNGPQNVPRMFFCPYIFFPQNTETGKKCCFRQVLKATSWSKGYLYRYTYICRFKYI